MAGTSPAMDDNSVNPARICRSASAISAWIGGCKSRYIGQGAAGARSPAPRRSLILRARFNDGDCRSEPYKSARSASLIGRTRSTHYVIAHLPDRGDRARACLRPQLLPRLIALGTPAFIAFGVFSLPAGWLADRWSRRKHDGLVFYGGLRVVAVGGGARTQSHRARGGADRAGNVRGDLSSGRHRHADRAGDLAGAVRSPSTACAAISARRLAAGTTRGVKSLAWVGRAAFLVPGTICVATAVLYLRLVPDEARKKRRAAAPWPTSRSRAALAATIFGPVSS